MGIITEQRSGMYGIYNAYFYSREAQLFMLEHIEEIVARWKR
jgi:hypothetical protein